MATPRQVYQALINAGATKLQAIGILANVINESGFNQEAVGDNGTSFGIVQQHGTQYSGLVTGNQAGDLTNQVKVIAQNGGFKAASGNTAGEAAGNFAAKYERCVGCQQGGAQYNARVANAAVVAGWVSSGKWPASAGAGASQAASSASSSSSSSGNDCAFGPSLPVVGQVCLVKRATIRHMVGGGLMVAGFFVVLPGVVIILAYGFRASGAAAAVSQVSGPAGRVVGAYQRRQPQETVTERAPIQSPTGGTQTTTTTRRGRRVTYRRVTQKTPGTTPGSTRTRTTTTGRRRGP